MNQAEKAELLEQIEKWNDADEFARSHLMRNTIRPWLK